MAAPPPPLTEPPVAPLWTFLDFPFAPDPATAEADIAILGIPYGKPYAVAEQANEQSRAPDAIRQAGEFAGEARAHFDWDLGGPLLDGRDVRVVDCGNVTAALGDPGEHYRRAEAAARALFAAGTVLVTLGGDHGIPIPVLRALEVVDGPPVTLVQIDAHMDWRDEVNGEREGYSSPIRRASEMPWIGKIVQIGLRGVGSARVGEVEAARAYGADLVTARELRETGVAAILERVPAGSPIYLTVDADGLDPSIMPGVMGPAPGGLDFHEAAGIVRGLMRRGRVLGMDLVEVAPARDIGGLTLVHAERLLCIFIGEAVRAAWFRRR